MSKEIVRPRPGTSRDFLEFVLNSEIRLRILRVLLDASLEKRDISTRLAEPRSTVDQNIKHLEERDLVERTSGGYRCTWFGRTVHGVVSGCVERIETSRRHDEFFAYAPVERDALEALAAADVTELSPTRLFLEFDRFSDQIRDSEWVQVMTPYLVPRFISVIEDLTDDRSLDVEIVTCDPATKGLLNDYGEELRVAVQSGVLSHFRSEEKIPLGLVLTDGITLAVAFDGEGLPRSVLKLEDERAERWARRYFDEWRERATPRHLERRVSEH